MAHDARSCTNCTQGLGWLVQAVHYDILSLLSLNSIQQFDRHLLPLPARTLCIIIRLDSHLHMSCVIIPRRSSRMSFYYQCLVKVIELYSSPEDDFP